MLVPVTMLQADRTATVLRFLLHLLKVFAWLLATHSAGMYTPSLLYTMHQLEIVCVTGDNGVSEASFLLSSLIPHNRTYNASNFEDQAMSHVCLEGPNTGDTPQMTHLPCGRLRAETFFPSCWDGQNLDSADHKSHVS